MVTLVTMVTLMFFGLGGGGRAARDGICRCSGRGPVAMGTSAVHLRAVSSTGACANAFRPGGRAGVDTSVRKGVGTILMSIKDCMDGKRALVRLSGSLLGLRLRAIRIRVRNLRSSMGQCAVLARTSTIRKVRLRGTGLKLGSTGIRGTALLRRVDGAAVGTPFGNIMATGLGRRNNFTTPKIPLLRVASVDALHFAIGIPRGSLIRFRGGRVCGVASSICPSVSLSKGMVVAKDGTGLNGDFPMRFRITGAGGLAVGSKVFNGMGLSSDGRRRNVLVPASTVARRGKGTGMCLVGGKGTMLRSVAVSEGVNGGAVMSNKLTANSVIMAGNFVGLFSKTGVAVGWGRQG